MVAAKRVNTANEASKKKKYSTWVPWESTEFNFAPNLFSSLSLSLSHSNLSICIFFSEHDERKIEQITYSIGNLFCWNSTQICLQCIQYQAWYIVMNLLNGIRWYVLDRKLEKKRNAGTLSWHPMKMIYNIQWCQFEIHMCDISIALNYSLFKAIEINFLFIFLTNASQLWESFRIESVLFFIQRSRFSSPNDHGQICSFYANMMDVCWPLIGRWKTWAIHNMILIYLSNQTLSFIKCNIGHVNSCFFFVISEMLHLIKKSV